MNFEQIEEYWETQKMHLALQVDKLAAEHVRTLVSRLTNFKISKIIYGMGSWSALGDDFPVVYEDGSTGIAPIRTLIELFMYPGSGLCWPVNITQDEMVALEELVRLNEWWVDTTGGEDVSFPENADA